MEPLTSGTLLPIIQLSITPVILISGEGALMLTLTGRMGRIVDRTRSLAGQVRQLAAAGDDATASATKAARDAVAAEGLQKPTILTVEVMGFGDKNCKEKDKDCFAK